MRVFLVSWDFGATREVVCSGGVDKRAWLYECVDVTSAELGALLTITGMGIGRPCAGSELPMTASVPGGVVVLRRFLDMTVWKGSVSPTSSTLSSSNSFSIDDVTFTICSLKLCSFAVATFTCSVKSAISVLQYWSVMVLLSVGLFSPFVNFLMPRNRDNSRRRLSFDDFSDFISCFWEEQIFLSHFDSSSSNSIIVLSLAISLVALSVSMREATSCDSRNIACDTMSSALALLLTVIFWSESNGLSRNADASISDKLRSPDGSTLYVVLLSGSVSPVLSDLCTGELSSWSAVVTLGSSWTDTWVFLHFLSSTSRLCSRFFPACFFLADLVGLTVLGGSLARPGSPWLADDTFDSPEHSDWLWSTPPLLLLSCDWAAVTGFPLSCSRGIHRNPLIDFCIMLGSSKTVFHRLSHFRRLLYSYCGPGTVIP